MLLLLGARLGVRGSLAAIGGWRMSKNADYFRRRAAKERVAAMKAAHSKVREAHLEMARLYDEKVAASATSEPALPQDLLTTG